jgi:predicted dehydrogenase
VVALYSRDLLRAREIAARCGVEIATDDLEGLLARGDIDAVTIASSNDRHYPYAMAALRAGKHVFCEKPMALGVAEAEEMTREARRSGVMHQTAFIFRYTDCLQTLRQRVLEGDIGTPYYAAVHGERYTAHPNGVRLATWRDDASLHGAGQMGEMGSHFIDTVNFVCGSQSGYICEVAAAAYTAARTVRDDTGAERAVDTPDLVSLLFRTEGGLQGNIVTSKATPSPVPYEVMHEQTGRSGHMGYIIVTGDRGALMASFSRGGGESLLRMSPGASEWERVSLPSGADDAQPHAVQRMMGSFLDNVIRGRPDGNLDPTFEDGYRSQAGIDAAMLACMSRRWEPVATDLP